MIVQNVMTGKCGLRCNLCGKTAYINAVDMFSAFEHMGWYIGGKNHNDAFICPECYATARTKSTKKI